MVVLDFSIVNVALPSIQHDPAFSASGLEWVVTAYAIAFGGLLILGLVCIQSRHADHAHARLRERGSAEMA